VDQICGRYRVFATEATVRLRAPDVIDGTKIEKVMVGLKKMWKKGYGIKPGWRTAYV
jgi:hypothetical protein